MDETVETKTVQKLELPLDYELLERLPPVELYLRLPRANFLLSEAPLVVISK